MSLVRRPEVLYLTQRVEILTGYAPNLTRAWLCISLFCLREGAQQLRHVSCLVTDKISVYGLCGAAAEAGPSPFLHGFGQRQWVP